MSLADILGWIATFLFSICFIPQIIKTARTKTVEGLSFLLLIISFGANIVAFWYATLINQTPLRIKYSLALVFLFICIILYIRVIRMRHVSGNHARAVLWFTGLSGSGKSTIAQGLKKKLEMSGRSTIIIDGDDVRAAYKKQLGFTREDVRENNRLIASLARVKSEQYDVVIVPIISPFREDRAAAKKVIGGAFVEVYIKCPLEECIRRDTKGLYSKAQKGELNNLIGYHETHPYEPPYAPDFVINSMARTEAQSIQLLHAFIMQRSMKR